MVREHTYGFEIAKQDLEIRGPGVCSGAGQGGGLMLRFADLQTDIHLLEAARRVAADLMADEPEIVAQHLQRWLGSREGFLAA